MQLNTPLPACALEFCPFDGSSFIILFHKLLPQFHTNTNQQKKNPNPEFPDLLVVGTYALQEGNTRTGQLLLVTSAEQQLRIIHTKVCAGIFDLKWAPQRVNGALWLGQADSSGGARVWRVGGSEVTAEDVLTVRGTSTGMSLSLDWSTAAAAAVADRVAVSHDTRDVSVFRIRPNGTAEEELHWKAHEHEVWITAFSRASPHVLLSGSDDCTLRVWDLRALSAGQAQVVKRGEAGFTTAQFCSTAEHLVAVGSYDEQLRLWDDRTWARPLLTTPRLSGGVWRTKWHPTDHHLLLLAHMHSGFSALRLSADLSAVETRLTHTDPHTSLAYGADWRRDGKLAGCCSFYDKQLSLWNVEGIRRAQEQ